MFGKLEALPPDPILGVSAAFLRDTTVGKVDLGVGVYRDDSGNTPIPAAVREAERDLVSAQTTKTYLGPVGNVEFNQRIAALALGPDAAGLGERMATVQTVGGCAALRLGAEVIRAADPQAVVYVSDPTWSNHEPLLGSAGLALRRYAYYDPPTRQVAFGPMMRDLERLPAGSVVLLHACCHNPTGVDLSREQWAMLVELLVRRGLVPFIDLAYQGLGDDLEADVAGLRLVAGQVPQLLLAVSCSKNFGLYRERVGALVVVAENATAAAAVATHQTRAARRMYSMPPDHGAAVVARVLDDPRLRSLWEHELRDMVARLKRLRAMLTQRLQALRPDADFSWLERQRGMFSLLGIDADAIRALRERCHVYLPPDGRINVAGLRESNLDRVAESIVSVLGP